MPWLHTFLCMAVPITNHLVSRAQVLNQAIVESNALFKILPSPTPPGRFLKYFKTPYKMKLSFFSLFFWRGFEAASSVSLWPPRRRCFGLHSTERRCTSPPLRVFCVHRFILRDSSHLLQTSAQWMLYVYRERLHPVFHYIFPSMEDWNIFFVFVWLRWGSWRMKKTLFFFFPRLPIRTIRNPIVKSTFLFSSITESHWSHWSVLETTDWEKDERVQSFPLWSVTIH